MTSTPRLPRPVATVAALALMGAGVVGVTAPDTFAPRPAAAATASADTSATSTPTSRYGAYKIHAWDGLRPAQVGDTWTFALPAMQYPPNRRRSEQWWSIDGAPVSYTEGEVVNYQAAVTAKIGPAADQRGQWHVLWQTVGMTDGQWKGPTLALVVADGQLRLTGGNGHPQHAPTAGRNYLWTRDLTPYTDQRTYTVKIQSYLSSDPAEGWVTAWVDGVKVVDRWRPQSRTGLRSGTFYLGSSEIYQRSGLYRGSDAAPAPTYEQWARHTAPLMF